MTHLLAPSKPVRSPIRQRRTEEPTFWLLLLVSSLLLHLGAFFMLRLLPHPVAPASDTVAIDLVYPPGESTNLATPSTAQPAQAGKLTQAPSQPFGQAPSPATSAQPNRSDRPSPAPEPAASDAATTVVPTRLTPAASPKPAPVKPVPAAPPVAPSPPLAEEPSPSRPALPQPPTPPIAPARDPLQPSPAPAPDSSQPETTDQEPRSNESPAPGDRTETQASRSPRDGQGVSPQPQSTVSEPNHSDPSDQMSTVSVSREAGQGGRGLKLTVIAIRWSDQKRDVRDSVPTSEYPQPLSFPNETYPAEVRLNAGQPITLVAQIDTQGNLNKIVQVNNSPAEGYTEYAKRLALGLKFSPPRQSGHSAPEGWVEVDLKLDLL